MTREEAIKTLRELWRETNDTWYEEVYNMAIEALQDDWTPVSEPPKENGVYMISLEDSIYPWGRFFNGKWFMLGTAREFGEYEVIAWQPLPKPYNGDTRGEE